MKTINSDTLEKIIYEAVSSIPEQKIPSGTVPRVLFGCHELNGKKHCIIVDRETKEIYFEGDI